MAAGAINRKTDRDEAAELSFEAIRDLAGRMLEICPVPPETAGELRRYLDDGVFRREQDYLALRAAIPLPPTGSSLAEAHPELCREWDRDRNGALTPAMLSRSSAEKVFWLYPRGHSFKSFVFNRIRGAGCPYCAGIGGIYVDPSESLAATNPKLAAEWHPSRNGNLTPGDVLPRSKKPAWWQCRSNPEHEWSAVIASRSDGRGCPYCGRKRFHVSISLAAEAPGMAAEWHPERNAPVTPAQVSSRDKKRKYWWRCGADPSHDWQATIFTRYQSSSGCPHCRHS